MQSVGELVEGLRKLRTGALLSIVSTILAFVGLAVIFASVGFAVSTDPNAIMAMLGTAAIGLGLLAATLVLSLIAFILWFMATGHFKRHDPVKLGIGRLGMILVVVGIILVLAMMVVIVVGAVAGSLGVFVSALMGGIVIAVLGGVLAFVGVILFALMLMRLPETPKVDSSLKTAGILYIIGMILSFILIGAVLMLVAVILIYTGSGVSIKALQVTAPPPP